MDTKKWNEKEIDTKERRGEGAEASEITLYKKLIPTSTYNITLCISQVVQCTGGSCVYRPVAALAQHGACRGNGGEPLLENVGV